MAPSRGCTSSMQGKIISRPGCVKRVETAPTFILGSPSLASRDSSSRTSLFLYTTWMAQGEMLSLQEPPQKQKQDKRTNRPSISRRAGLVGGDCSACVCCFLLCLDEPASQVTTEREWHSINFDRTAVNRGLNTALCGGFNASNNLEGG